MSSSTNILLESFDYLAYVLTVAFTPTVAKVLFSVLFVVFSFFFDVAHINSLGALFVLVLMDFVSGITASKKAGDPIRSAKIRHTALKITAYFGAIAGAHLAESGVFSYIAVIDETVIAFFLITELVSLMENVGRMGFETPKKVLNQLTDIKSKL